MTPISALILVHIIWSMNHGMDLGGTCIIQLQIKKGSSFNTAGDNTWFEILLLSEGPSLYKWDYARSIDNNVDAKDLPSAASITRVNERISRGKKLSEILGTEEREYPFGTIKIEWGEILED